MAVFSVGRSSPAALLAFGEQGLAIAVMIYAARCHPGALSPLKQTRRLSVLWAIAAALLLRATGTELPAALAKPIHMLGQASIPVMLLILGFQLENGVALDRLLSLLAALAVRLIGSAFIAHWISAALELETPECSTVHNCRRFRSYKIVINSIL